MIPLSGQPLLDARGPIVQCAVNISEGRRVNLVEEIVSAAMGHAGSVVADYSSDRDHNRLVLTLLGSPEPVGHSLLAAARRAACLLDLRQHQGAHPRMGIVDVVPFTPISLITLRECAVLARRVAASLAFEIGLGVYFYGAAASADRPSALPEIRRAVGATSRGAGIPDFHRMLPDLGEPSPALGAVVVGARRPLVAYNIGLASGNESDARWIAAAVRAERATTMSLHGVRALGLWLPTAGAAQVSLNLTRPDRTPIAVVREQIAGMIHRRNAAVLESGRIVTEGDGEIVGLIPEAALGGHPVEDLRLPTLRETQIVERWLRGPARPVDVG